MPNMRAKLKVTKVEKFPSSEKLTFAAVCKNEGYAADGSDENNTFAKFTPSADLSMVVNNPELLEKFEEGQVYYVDFSPAE